MRKGRAPGTLAGRYGCERLVVVSREREQQQQEEEEGYLGGILASQAGLASPRTERSWEITRLLQSFSNILLPRCGRFLALPRQNHPKMAADDAVHFEALIRWVVDHGGYIHPDLCFSAGIRSSRCSTSLSRAMAKFVRQSRPPATPLVLLSSPPPKSHPTPNCCVVLTSAPSPSIKPAPAFR